MNVAVDAMLLRPPHTGVQRYIIDLIEAVSLHAADIRFSAYTKKGSGWNPPAAENLSIYETRAGRTRLGRICWEQLSLPFRLRRDRIDVFHAPGYVMPVLAPVIMRRPTVLTVHDLIALDRAELVSMSNGFHYGLMMPLSMRMARCVIVPTRAVADRIEKNSFRVKRLEVIPWGIHGRYSAVDTGSDVETLEAMGINKPYILSVGRAEPKKNAAQLIKAFFAMKMDTSLPHSLVLAGPRGPSRKAEEQLVLELQMKDRILFPGHVLDNDLPCLYRNAELTVSVSVEEGFGFTPLESLACGTPVLVSDIPAHRELLGDAVPMVGPEDLPGLREMITYVLKDNSAAGEIARKGREHIKRYTWEECAKRTCAVYRECA